MARAVLKVKKYDPSVQVLIILPRISYRRLRHVQMTILAFVFNNLPVTHWKGNNSADPQD